MELSDTINHGIVIVCIALSWFLSLVGFVMYTKSKPRIKTDEKT